MATFSLILMVLSLIAALERTNRRQSLRAPGLHGSLDRNDRDWARIKLDLIALGDQEDPNHRKGSASRSAGVTNRRNGPPIA